MTQNSVIERLKNIHAKLNGPFGVGRFFMGLALLALYYIALWRTAWLTDDSLITARTVLNFLYGYGPVYNIGERVQAYTHPLWFFLYSAQGFISIRIFGWNIFGTLFLICFYTSIAAFFFFLFAFSKQWYNVLLGAIALMLSRAFIDFSTSGLENPLTHLLLLLFLYYALKEEYDEGGRYLTVLSGLTAALYLNRPDSILLVVFPLLLVTYRRLRSDGRYRPVLRAAFFGLCPIILWMLFSTIYYGFPLPNTAYAKLSHAIDQNLLTEQGLYYLYFTFSEDKITVISIIAAFVMMLMRSNLSRAFALGYILYMIYLVRIGGDFMLGRFFSGMFVLSVAFLVSTKVDYRDLLTGSVPLFVLVVSAIPLFFLVCGGRAFETNWILANRMSEINYELYHGVGNERGFYARQASLPQYFAKTETFLHRDVPFQFTGRNDVWVTYGSLGGWSMVVGPNLFSVDQTALADPLLARLPGKFFRIGHFFREMPPGYKQSLMDDTNVIEDPEVHAYYDIIRLITRGPIFSVARFKAILAMNLGMVPAPKRLDYPEPVIEETPPPPDPVEEAEPQPDPPIEPAPVEEPGPQPESPIEPAPVEESATAPATPNTDPDPPQP